MCTCVRQSGCVGLNTWVCAFLAHKQTQTFLVWHTNTLSFVCKHSFLSLSHARTLPSHVHTHITLTSFLCSHIALPSTHAHSLLSLAQRSHSHALTFLCRHLSGLMPLPPHTLTHTHISLPCTDAVEDARGVRRGALARDHQLPSRLQLLGTRRDRQRLGRD